MRKFNKTYLVVFILLALFWAISLIAESGDKWTSSYDRTNGNSHWRVDSSGYLVPGKTATYDLGTSSLLINNAYITTDNVTTLAVSGVTTIGGLTTISDILTVSSDAANGSVQIGGAFSTFPTSGFRAGTIIFYNGTNICAGSATFYGSTSTVTSASCWVALH